MTCFIKVFTLSRWSGSNLTTSPGCACTVLTLPLVTSWWSHSTIKEWLSDYVARTRGAHLCFCFRACGLLALYTRPALSRAPQRCHIQPDFVRPPRLRICPGTSFAFLGSFGHLLPEEPSFITTEDLIWLVSLFFNPLLQLYQKCGSSFFTGRCSLSSNILLFSSNLFLNLCTTPCLK